jgi:hypothetical protein
MVGVREFLILQSVQINCGTTQPPFQWVPGGYTPKSFGGKRGADPEAEFMFDFKKVCYKSHALSITVAYHSLQLFLYTYNYNYMFHDWPNLNLKDQSVFLGF